MWEEIISLAVGSGLWAVLFCLLLSYVLTDSKKREDKYVEMISALSEKLDIVQDIKEDTQEILNRTKAKKSTSKSKVASLETASVGSACVSANATV